MEPGPHFEKTGQPTIDLHGAGRWLSNPRQNLQKSRLSRSVFADNPQILALQDPERDVPKGPEVPLGDFLVIAPSRPDQTTKSSHAFRGDILEKGSLISF